MTRNLLFCVSTVLTITACGGASDNPNFNADTASDVLSDDGSVDATWATDAEPDSSADIAADTNSDAGDDIADVSNTDDVPDADATDVRDVRDADTADVPDTEDVPDADATDVRDADTADVPDTEDVPDADATDGRDADTADTDTIDADTTDVSDPDTPDTGGGPVISRIPDQISARNTVTPSTVAVTFTVSDPGYAAHELTLSAVVANPELWDDDEFTFLCLAGECRATIALRPEACRPQTVIVEVTNPEALSSSVEFTVTPLTSTLVTTTADDGRGSLRAALIAASDGDVIGFDAELFPPGGTILLEGELNLQSAAELTVDGCDVRPVIDGGGGGRVFGSHTGTDYLRRITVAGGYSSVSGGAVSVDPTGILTVSECTFRGNTAQRTSASSSCGGAIVVTGVLHVERSLFVRNRAIAEIGDATGGAICILESERGRTATTVTIVNSTFFDNSSVTTLPGVGFGGAVASEGDVNVSISHSTIVGNRAQTIGGGLNASGATPMVLSHTIVAGNRSPGGSVDLVGVFAGSNYNLIGDADGATGIDTAATDMTFLSLGGASIEEVIGDALGSRGGPTRTLALVVDGPAIDTGDEAIEVAPPTDQRGSGFARIVGARIDIGATEFARD
jgi:hypothetical protein